MSGKRTLMESLKPYRDKRNFQCPPEPIGKAPAPPSPAALHGARVKPMPKALRPQLATLARDVPQGVGWIHEIKFDGYRIIAQIEDGKTRLGSRNGQDWTERFPELAALRTDPWAGFDAAHRPITREMRRTVGLK